MFSESSHGVCNRASWRLENTASPEIAALLLPQHCGDGALAHKRTQCSNALLGIAGDDPDWPKVSPCRWRSQSRPVDEKPAGPIVALVLKAGALTST